MSKLISDPDQIRAITLHALRTGDQSRLKLINPMFAFVGLYPYTFRTAEQCICPKCKGNKTFEIGYGNFQCDECLFVYKLNQDKK